MGWLQYRKLTNRVFEVVAADRCVKYHIMWCVGLRDDIHLHLDTRYVRRNKSKNHKILETKAVSILSTKSNHTKIKGQPSPLNLWCTLGGYWSLNKPTEYEFHDEDDEE